MATYEYKCKSCNTSKTILRGMSEKEVLPTCDSCQSKLFRVYSSVSVTFNGNGFYSTDK